MKSLIFVMALAYINTVGASPQSKARSNDTAPQGEAVGKANVPDHFGTATMLKDRTIVLSYIYYFPKGGHTAPAKITYTPRHPKYKEILRRLGGMKPGEVKGLEPWPATTEVHPPDLNRLPPELKDYPWPETSRVPERR